MMHYFRSFNICISNPWIIINNRYSQNFSQKVYDILIVGGGIIGCAVGRHISLKYPRLKCALVEKENELGVHQSGHNSGVIHSGIYYVPGSLKAKLCVKGSKMMYKYLDKKNIPYHKYGKLIVAVEKHELSQLENLYKRGKLNGLENLQIIEKNDIKLYEPNCAGLRAIWCPDTGIVDYKIVTKSFAKDFQENGGNVMLNFRVNRFNLLKENNQRKVELISEEGKVLKSRFVITASGLHSDRVAKMSGSSAIPKVIPFKGEYLVLSQQQRDLVKGIIYPLPRLPFLGVHFTPKMDNSLWLGPNAILATKREGYLNEFDFKDIADYLFYPGFLNFTLKHFNDNIKELYRSININSQIKILKKYIPKLKLEHVVRGPCGIRAQLMDINGNLIDDFLYDSGVGDMCKHILHIRNTPSPAATASLAIAENIVNKMEEESKELFICK